MKRSKIPDKERFHYCMPMEISEWEFYGIKSRAPGMATAYSDSSYFKKRSRALIKKIKKRINDIVTNDEIFRLMLFRDLKILDREFREVTPSSHNEIDIIGYFFYLVAHLLGWAHFEGKFFRIPIYYQTREQQEEDLRKSSNLKIQTGLYEVYKKRQLIKKLLSEGDSYPTVASIMGMT
ncbi:hypothetical protein KA005_07385, partial [bacterium]|nr:hypothetical protein [bacterium]